MPDVLPPPFVESEVQKELDKAAKDARLISAIETMTGTAQENERALIQEMEQLSGYALEIDNGFRNVTRVLSDVKTNGASDDVRETCTTLHQKWSEHHTEYVELLWRSREVAGRGRSAVEDFLKILLYIQDPTGAIESKKEELQNQKKKLDQDKLQAANLYQNFDDLSFKVKTFTEDFEAMVKTFNLTAQNEKIKELGIQLQLLKDTLTQEICTKLGAFVSVWAMIRVDIHEIAVKIDYTENTTKEKVRNHPIPCIISLRKLCTALPVTGQTHTDDVRALIEGVLQVRGCRHQGQPHL
ncbi:hypothetical protein EDD18DRAFT_116111 [Armillaria luteobubalina]|uniref:Uncharacterized protein n=1 Tax=Armillaria luteobubalina TaxID=153913 RepID=A0AA39QA27_9AGAR|nr:hypothetical protein EDD18DRAFT_116111 [Armillaria luteobubalina]